MARFPDNESCRDFLRLVLWNNEPKCPSCKNLINNYGLRSRNSYQCSICRKQFNILSGTVFQGSQVSLTKWFQAIYYFTTAKKGISSVQLGKWIGVTQKTAWLMLAKLRMALSNGDRMVLNGIVECDETFIVANPSKDMRLAHKKKLHDKKVKWRIEKYFGGEKKDGEPVKRGRRKGMTKAEIKKIKKLKELHSLKAFGNERTVFGMFERNGNIILKFIDAASSAEVLKPMITHISEESTVMTDESNIYNQAKYIFKSHKAINHKQRKFCNGEITTNRIENVFRHLKSTLKNTYGQRIKNKHLQLYLDEYSYRWNHKNSSVKAIFDSFFNKAIGQPYTLRMIKYELWQIAA